MIISSSLLSGRIIIADYGTLREHDARGSRTSRRRNRFTQTGLTFARAILTYSGPVLDILLLAVEVREQSFRMRSHCGRRRFICTGRWPRPYLMASMVRLTVVGDRRLDRGLHQSSAFGSRAAGSADQNRDRIGLPVGRADQTDVVVARLRSFENLPGARLVCDGPARGHSAAQAPLPRRRSRHQLEQAAGR